jgi:hypothetical protein
MAATPKPVRKLQKKWMTHERKEAKKESGYPISKTIRKERTKEWPKEAKEQAKMASSAGNVSRKGKYLSPLQKAQRSIAKAKRD